MVEIRIAKPEDSAAIAEVLGKAFGTYREDYTDEAFAIVTPAADEITRRLEDGPQWVATIGDSVVGTVSVTVEEGDLYVRSMAVAPGVQGRGVGHKLLDAIDEYAAGTEFERIFLYTTYFSAGAKELYEKHGYAWVRDTTAEEWYGVPGLEMDKKLEGKKLNAIGS
ncbi:MAG: GNAT family N-acetyltransferase [Pyrinomonadaceae bacterium]|nr:GNAT family N-acetyltransferase [Chloracidobacterium sp.]MBP7415443.1 GNAT family N-acetyltransferase [Pyrinomonadaceae bacterium]